LEQATGRPKMWEGACHQKNSQPSHQKKQTNKQTNKKKNKNLDKCLAQAFRVR